MAQQLPDVGEAVVTLDVVDPRAQTGQVWKLNHLTDATTGDHLIGLVTRAEPWNNCYEVLVLSVQGYTGLEPGEVHEWIVSPSQGWERLL